MKIHQEHIAVGYAINKDVASKIQSEKNRTITFVASTPDIDRDGEITNSKGWLLDNYIKNPVIGYQHQVMGHGLCIAPDPDDIIGVGKNIRVDTDSGNLLVDIKFEDKETNPKAEKIFRKVLNGTLNTVSVGFIPTTNEDGDITRKGIEKDGENPDANYFFGQELLEISVVNVPANPGAVALRKGIKSSVAGAVVNLSKMLNKSWDDLEKMTVGEIVLSLEGTPKENKDWVVSSTDDTNLTKEDKDITATHPCACGKQADNDGELCQECKDNEEQSSSEASVKDGAAELEIMEAEILIKQKQIEHE